MLPRILEALDFRSNNTALDFRSNNTAHRPILDAIDIIKEHRDSRRHYFTIDDVPVEGVVRGKWRELVVEAAPDGTEQTVAFGCGSAASSSRPVIGMARSLAR